MALLACKVTKGLREAEATVEIKDFHDRNHFLPVDRDFLNVEDGKHYLPVTVMQIDPKSKAALIGLPLEADSGAHRVWVKLAQLTDLTEGPA
ncbi:MAG: hypothetical protein HYS12_07070 [Planctomycetes bacterium]|nr:hypothetical protein [Planctomycetota bacterium]